MKFLFFANTDWYLFNYQLGLIGEIESRGVEVVLACPPGPYVGELRARGRQVVEVPMDRLSTRPWKELRVLGRVHRILRQQTPDLLHSFTIKPVVYGGLAARFAGVENRVNSLAGLGYVFTSASLRARVLRSLVEVLLRLAFADGGSRLIVQNDADRARFVDRDGIDPRRVQVIRGSGVDTDRFYPTERRPGEEETVVCMATRLLHEKGIEQYVVAARILRERGLSLRFLLAGAPDPGNPGSTTDAELNRWRSEGAVELVGQVEDMPSLLRSSDIVVLPSYYGEGVPRILLEAAATALPIVASDIPGCRQIVRHGVNGLLVPPQEPGLLADAIGRLQSDSALRESMGIAGRQQVLEQFDQRLIIAETLRLYSQLVELPDAVTTIRNTTAGAVS